MAAEDVDRLTESFCEIACRHFAINPVCRSREGAVCVNHPSCRALAAEAVEIFQFRGRSKP